MWFKQDSVREPKASLPDGASVRLDFVLDETQEGFLATCVGYVVNQIRTAIASNSHGWSEISEAEYNDAVKKKSSPSSQWLKRQRARGLTAGMFQPRVNQDEDAQSAAAIVAAKPDPISVPTAEQLKLPPRPRVGKMVSQ